MTDDPDAIKAYQEEEMLNLEERLEAEKEVEITKAWRLLEKNGYEVKIRPPEGFEKVV